jgi:hypothetical protein
MLAKLGWVEGQPIGLSSDGAISTWLAEVFPEFILLQ